MPFDYKKEFKDFYLPPAKPHIVHIPKMQFVAVRGKGNPNEEDGEYNAICNRIHNQTDGFLRPQQWLAAGLFNHKTSS